jgi:type II secretory pathway component PulJ
VEAEEMTFKIVALVIIALLLVTDYAMLVVASRADERAERMYEEWKESKGV